MIILTDKGPRLITVGVKPTTPYVYWDYDLAEGEDPEKAVDLLNKWAGYKSQYTDESGEYEYCRHYCIRATKNGYHLIMQMESWEVAQEFLYELHRLTGKASILNCRKQRIRIMPKIHLKTGEIVSGAPVAVLGCMHYAEWDRDIRTGIPEVYFTYDKGINTGLTEDEWKVLKEFGETK